MLLTDGTNSINSQTEHKKLIKRITKIFENSNFDLVDSEIHFSFSSDFKDDFSFDVCGIDDEHNAMFVIECKTGGMGGAGNYFRIINNNIEKIINGKITNIISSDSDTLRIDDLDSIDEIYYGFALTKESVFKNQRKNIEQEKWALWNEEAIKYFERVSLVLGNLTKKELYREFNLEIPAPENIPVQALKFRQGKNEIFLCSLTPQMLLNISYVSRRSTRRNEGYQRIINADRLATLTKFISSTSKLIMPNPIILSFDEDISLRIQNGYLNLPNKYCTAWIIDGQHRVYAFKDVDLTKDDWKRSKFTLPVVAFKKLPVSDQSETFVNINYYQKRVETLLMYDLASTFRSFKNELAWPSKLTKKLNEEGPLKGKIRISELESGKPLTISNFVRPILDELLGYNAKENKFEGPLIEIQDFNKNEGLWSSTNKKAFSIHFKILKNYFSAIKDLVESNESDWEKKAKNKGFFKSSVISAFILVLAAILWKYPLQNNHYEELLDPIYKINFNTKEFEFPRGYSQVQNTAKKIINKINNKLDEDFEIKLMSKRRKE